MAKSGSVTRLLWSLLAVAACGSAFAQTAGNLRGTVTDESGGVVAGASVVLKSKSTSFEQRQTSDERGGFFFAAVLPGLYTLEASKGGFRAFKAEDLRVGANDTLAIAVRLTIGGVTEDVEVVAASELLQTSTGTREGLITPRQIESLSIVSRNPTELIRILPGVVAPDPSWGAFDAVGVGAGFGGGGTAFSINGARPEHLTITMDGANLRDVGNNQGMLNVPNNEFVAEVKVQTSNYAAEFGSSATSVQAVTKSGSAELHGSLYYYGRPYQLQANDRSRNYANPDRDRPELDRPKSRFHYPGLTLSGPVLIPGTRFNQDRDKAFFFFGYELQEQEIDNGVTWGVVPTAEMRVGDFSQYGWGQALGMGTTLRVPGGWPDAGTEITDGDFRRYVTPTGLALMHLYPPSNYDDPENRYNYFTGRLKDLSRQQGILRVDYNVSDNTRAYVRLALDREAPERHRGLWFDPNGIETPTPLIQKSIGLSAALNVTSILSPSSTNEVVLSWSRLKNDNTWEDKSKMLKATYGITDIDSPFEHSDYVPQLTNSWDLSRASMWFVQDVDNMFSYNGFLRLQDTLTKVLSGHAVKVGAVAERQWKQQNFQNDANVWLHFNPWANGSSGNDLADILAGRPFEVQVGSPAAIGLFVAWNLEAFAQDSWKIRNVTLEYGLRFARWTVNKEVNDLGAIFLPDYYVPGAGAYLNADHTGPGVDRLNGVAYAARGEVPQQLTNDRPLIFMPRTSFAWDLAGDGATIVRGGAGAFYVRDVGDAQYGPLRVPPNAYHATLSSYSYPAGDLNYGTITHLDPFSALNAPGDIATPNPNDLRWARTYNASLSVARRLPWRNVIEVGYVGSWGRNLLAQQEQNVVGLDPEHSLMAYSSDPILRAAAANSIHDAFRPYPTIGVVKYPVHVGESNYNSLQVTLSRPAGRFTYLAAYTLSRAAGTFAPDNATIDATAGWKSRSYGLAPTDRTHVLNVSWSWSLGAPLETGVLKHLLNDWNVSGISTWFTGYPGRVGFSGDLVSPQMANAWLGTHDLGTNIPGKWSPGAIAPTYRCDPALGASAGPGEKIYDLACIGIPALGETGDFWSPYTLRLPGKSFHDLTVFKDFGLGGSRRLQIRLGVFNIFNQAYADAVSYPDIWATLETSCNRRLKGVPDGVGGVVDICDPTGGFGFTDDTLENFGKIITKHGHRSIEIAARLFF